jgi:transposase
MLHKETKILILKAYEKTHNATEIAKYYSINRSTVYSIVNQYKKTGNLDVHTNKRGRKPKLTTEDIEAIKNEILKNPDITILEIKNKLNLSVNPETIRLKVNALGFRRKKKSIYAAERDRPRCSSKT